MDNNQKGKIVIYHAKGGKTALEVKLQQETVWLNLKQMTELFDHDNSLISRHIRNIYEERELPVWFNCCKFCNYAAGTRSGNNATTRKET